MRLIFASILLISLSSCWPTSISFKDSNMPPEWQEFYVVTLDNKAANSPLSYSVDLSEAVKDGIQNRTKLNLANAADDAQIEIEERFVEIETSVNFLEKEIDNLEIPNTEELSSEVSGIKVSIDNIKKNLDRLEEKVNKENKNPLAG